MLSNTIRELRKTNKMTQTELSSHLHVTQQAVAKWEKGVAEPDSKTILNLADLFGVSTDYLLGREAAAPSAGASSSVNPHDAQLLAAYHLAPPEIRNIVDTALERYKTQNPAASGSEAM